MIFLAASANLRTVIVTANFLDALASGIDKTLKNTLQADPVAGWTLWCRQSRQYCEELDVKNPFRRQIWALRNPESRNRIDDFALAKTLTLQQRAADLRIRRDEALMAAFSEPGALSLLNFAWHLGLSPENYAASPNELLQTLDALLDLAHTALSDTDFSEKHDPYLALLLSGELPWTLALLLPDLKISRPLARKAAAVINESLQELLDGTGLPRASHLDVFRPLLASWTRCLDLGTRTGRRPWKAGTQRLYEWAIQQALRGMRKDGSLVLSMSSEIDPPGGHKVRKTDTPTSLFLEMMEAALPLDRDPNDIDTALVVLPGLRNFGQRRRSEVDPRELPQESHFSDWAGIAVLRSGWEHEEPSLTVIYGEHEPLDISSDTQSVPFGGWTDTSISTELNFRNRALWTGPLRTLLRFNDQPIHGLPRRPQYDTAEEQDGENGNLWAVLCSEQDSAYDYLELQRELSHNFLLQRHFLLLHDEEILLFADTVLPDPSRKDRETGIIEYELSFPLAPQIKTDYVQRSKKETELLLSGPPVPNGTKNVDLARIFPLALPEWRTQDQTKETSTQNKKSTQTTSCELISGVLEENEGVLTYRLWTRGTAIFAPLVFDLSATRLKQAYTWRRLTVGEHLESVPQDQATGFRLRCGKRQYLIYRSMTGTANRSILGHNLIDDFFFGFFTREGTIEPILEVTPE